MQIHRFALALPLLVAGFAPRAVAQHSYWNKNPFELNTPNSRLKLQNAITTAKSTVIPGVAITPPGSLPLQASPGGLTHGNFPFLEPTDFCVAHEDDIGCLPTMEWSGQPSCSLGAGFVVSCTNVRSQRFGALIYGFDGTTLVPFHGGMLCVRPPLHFTRLLSSGGNANPDCSGVFSLDFNTFIANAIAAPMLLHVPGTMIHAQWLSRARPSPGQFNLMVSNGIRFVLGF